MGNSGQMEVPAGCQSLLHRSPKADGQAMRLTRRRAPDISHNDHRAPAFVVSQSGFLMALPAAGSSQGSDMPTPPPGWCGAGGPHTGGSRDGGELSGTEGQADVLPQKD